MLRRNMWWSSMLETILLIVELIWGISALAAVIVALAGTCVPQMQVFLFGETDRRKHPRHVANDW
ncbi:hypothetical protein [Sphingomonas sp. Leaf20]|uniref:hypothetical protein n=1 Tax=Sphingomonas sp. Leaf20 TaxID=1735685 RepID=UPI0006F3E410|nr:hypothetical protein [Sphingomonas sp. Leaf20]